MANLSPSELASLLGPIEHSLFQQGVTARPVSEDLPQWNRFADQFARALTTRLRPLVKAASRVQSTARKTQTAQAVIASHNARSVVEFWQSNRSFEPMSIILSQPLVTTFVDRLLGGRSGPSIDEPVNQRPLTEIDHQLAARLIDAARQCVMEAVAVESTTAEFTAAELPDAASAKPALESKLKLELNHLPSQMTSFEEAWLPDSLLLRLSFELRFVQGGGSLDLLIPFDVASTVEFQDQSNPSENQSSGELSGDALSAVSACQSQQTSVVAQLARITLSDDDLRSLTVGDVLLTDIAPEESLDVVVGGTTRFQAESGSLHGHKAIRLLAQVASK